MKAKRVARQRVSGRVSTLIQKKPTKLLLSSNNKSRRQMGKDGCLMEGGMGGTPCGPEGASMGPGRGRGTA